MRKDWVFARLDGILVVNNTCIDPTLFTCDSNLNIVRGFLKLNVLRFLAQGNQITFHTTDFVCRYLTSSAAAESQACVGAWGVFFGKGQCNGSAPVVL